MRQNISSDDHIVNLKIAAIQLVLKRKKIAVSNEEILRYFSDDSATLQSILEKIVHSRSLIQRILGLFGIR